MDEYLNNLLREVADKVRQHLRDNRAYLVREISQEVLSLLIKDRAEMCHSLLRQSLRQTNHLVDPPLNYREPQDQNSQ
jgi:hypothetical protein